MEFIDADKTLEFLSAGNIAFLYGTILLRFAVSVTRVSTISSPFFFKKKKGELKHTLSLLITQILIIEREISKAICPDGRHDFESEAFIKYGIAGIWSASLLMDIALHGIGHFGFCRIVNWIFGSFMLI